MYETIDKYLGEYEREAYESPDWDRVMSAIDEIRQIPNEEYFLTKKNKKLVLARFEITKNGTFWIFWYGADQHIISFEHIPNEPTLSQASSYFDALEKSVNAFYKLRTKLQDNTYQLTK